MKNEDGLAYGIMMYVVFIVVFAVVVLLFSEPINAILTGYVNPAIASGDMSMQTAHGISFSVMALRAGPIIGLFFGVLWAVNRANYKKGGGA